MNQILQQQNNEQFLQYLAAQRQLYNEEKRWMTLWVVVTVIVAIAGTGAIAVLQPQMAYVTWITIILVVAEFSLIPFIMSRRKDAAKVQELFDCELLELKWNDVLTAKPSPETILLAAERFKKQQKPEEWEKLKNWYNPRGIENMPLYQARIACQQENIWWDAKQRREWVRWVKTSLAVLGFFLLTVGLVTQGNFQNFLIGPGLLVLPIMISGLAHIAAHHKALDRLQELHEHANKLMEDASNGISSVELINQQTRQLQNEIFHHRSNDPPILSWFYEKYHALYERLVASGQSSHKVS